MTLVTITSCNQNKSNKSSLTHLNDSDISDNNDIFGTWTMCAVSDSSTITQMNVCPTITFDSAGTGYVQKGIVITENFVWTLKKNDFKIETRNRISSPTFRDNRYYAYLTRQKDTTNLLLRHNNQSYYLTRLLRR